MPLTNGVYQPWSVSCTLANQTTQPGFSCILNTITTNIPWAFGLVLASVYVLFLMKYAGRPGKKKYVYISLVMMIVGFVFESFGLVSVYIAAAGLAMFALAIFFVRASGAQ